MLCDTVFQCINMATISQTIQVEMADLSVIGSNPFHVRKSNALLSTVIVYAVKARNTQIKPC